MPEPAAVALFFRCDAVRVELVPVVDDPARTETVLYRFACPRCARDRKIPAARVTLLHRAPELVTIDGIVHCPHECGWSAEIVRGIAHVLGRDHG